MRSIVAIALSLGVLVCSSGAQAQSLKRDNPSPMQPGLNTGHVDGFVGPNYWICNAGPGAAHWHVIFRSGGIMGNPQNTTISVSIQDPSDKWITTKAITSIDKPGECSFDGTLKKPMKIIMTVAPPSNTLLRMGGDYEIEGSGAVSFLPKSSADPVVGMYKQMGGFTQDYGNAKFNADGSIVTISGTTGRWTVFDADSKTYLIDIPGQKKMSGKLVPAFGLLDGSGGIIYQATP